MIFISILGVTWLRVGYGFFFFFFKFFFFNRCFLKGNNASAMYKEDASYEKENFELNKHLIDNLL